MTDAPVIEVDDLAEVRRLVEASHASAPLRPVGLREVVSGPGAVAALPAVLGRLGLSPDATVVVLTDDVPKVAGTGDVLDAVRAALPAAGPAVTLVTPPAGVVHADEATVDHAVAAVAAVAAAAGDAARLSAERPAGLVTVGSGTLADIGKVVAQRLDLVHVVVQTAASVNGYADDQSVLLRHGTKRTTPSRWPDALVIDADVLAAAPVAMTRSGLGDLVSTYSAAADWRLASIVGFDPGYLPSAVAVLRTDIDQTLSAATGLGTGEPGAVQALARSLTLGGLAMGLAGRTSPSSGAEHTISHLLEMRAGALGTDPAAHGAQVGAASVIVTRLWASMRERLASGGLTVQPLDPGRLRARVDLAFGPLDPTGAVAGECWSAYEPKLTWVNRHLAQLADVCREWSRYDDELGALLAGPDDLAQTLRAAGAAVRLTDLDPDPGLDAARWAVANCHLMRDRFTIVDLAEITGCWTADDVDRAMA